MGKLSERFDKRFEEKYEFRLARRSDVEAIMTYIDECWRKDHILSKNRELFEYEFCDGEDVHFVLAIDRETGEIEGLDGYYLTSSRKENFDVWGSMWSVRKDHRNLPMLGIAIANHYYQLLGFRYEIGVGVNSMTATPLHQQHFQVATGTLNHYYMLQELSEYLIARIVNPMVSKAYEHADSYRLVRAESLEDVKRAFNFDHKITTYPYKDGWYVGHRFFEHPVYEYQVYLLIPERIDGRENDERIADAVIVMRDVSVDGLLKHHVLRIVDYMGDIRALREVQKQLYELMDDNCEYIDFYCYGYEEQEILDAGFVKRMTEDVNIIPSYFEPFEQRNVEYWFNSDAKENFVICKADADQDRPNM